MKILLIGDSIRKGYDKYVKDKLEGKAEVYYPSENCRFALYVLRQFHVWINEELNLNGEEIDLVHWNAGLWDTLTLFNDGTLTPLDDYLRTVKRVHKRIKTVCPNAKIIFATSTPVLEHRFLKPERSIRYNKDIELYNSEASKVLSELGEKINDIYSVVKGVDESYYSDMTHLYTNEGTCLIGNKVLDSICAELNISYQKDSSNKEYRPDSIIGL